MITFLNNRTQLIDHQLITLWQLLELHHEKSLTLFAVGGYGRKELFPHSDVDILIIYSELNESAQYKLSEFINHAWNLGFNLSHSIRSLENCFTFAKANIKFFTSLLDLRFLTGNQKFTELLQQKIDCHALWSPENFLFKRIELLLSRWKKYFNSFELDVKNFPGGLRDYDEINWITRYCKLIDPENILEAKEYYAYITNYHWLINKRLQLHLTNNFAYNHMNSASTHVSTANFLTVVNQSHQLITDYLINITRSIIG